MKVILLSLLSVALIGCKGAENFFDESPSFLVSGKFTVDNNQYIDDDTPAGSGNNSLTSPQSIVAPARVAGHANSSNDSEDCYSLSGVSDNDNIQIKAGSGITAATIKLYSNTSLREEEALASENTLTKSLDGANRVCVEVSSGSDLYTLAIGGSGAANEKSNLGTLTALLVDNDDDDVRSDASVPAISTNEYDYALSGTENNSYRVVISTDLDEDDVYCEIGEICGELNLSADLTADLPNQNLNSGFQACFDTLNCEAVTDN